MITRRLRPFSFGPCVPTSCVRSIRFRNSSTQPDPRAQLRAHTTAVWGPLLPRLKTAVPLLLALLTGISFGTLLTTALIPPATPEPGSKEDQKRLEELQKSIDGLFLTQIYRGKCLSAGRIIRGERDDSWREITSRSTLAANGEGVREAEIRFEREKHANRQAVQERERQIVASGGAEEVPVGKSRDERVEALRQQAEALGLDIDQVQKSSGEGRFARDEESLTKRTLSGSRGLAVERVFWNAKDAELVAVLWLGEGLTGWPRVVHGGLLATAAGEKLGMAATLLRDSIESAPRDHTEDWRELSSLEIQYKKPTYAAAFYVIRAIPKLVVSGEHRSIEIDGVLETLEGQPCVQVKGCVTMPQVTTTESWWRGLIPW